MGCAPIRLRVTWVTLSFVILWLGASLDAQTAQFKRGDADCNGCVNLCDAVAVAAFNFLGDPTPCCLDAADANDDGRVRGSITDTVYLIQYVALDGDPPPAPGPDVCGPDGTPHDPLRCAEYDAALCSVQCPDVEPCNLFKRGDANCDGCVDQADADFITAHFTAGGDAPCCEDAADANDDGFFDNSDASYITSYLLGGPEPPHPGPDECGIDYTLDDLFCTGYGSDICSQRCKGPTPTFKRGDTNCDGCVNLCDAVALAGFNFLGFPTPCCSDAADANDDGEIIGTLTDTVYLIQYLSLGGDPPPDPGPDACGADGTPDDRLGCAGYEESLCDVECSDEEPCNLFKRGDANCDGCVDQADAEYILAYLFTGGEAPCCEDAADANDDGVFNDSDASYITNYLLGGPEPPHPGPDRCGIDYTLDSLLCTGYTPDMCSEVCVVPSPAFKRGDANADGCVDVCDALYITDYLFTGGPVPPCLAAADVNDDGVIAPGGVTDAAYLLTFFLTGGPPPSDPGPTVCGPDPTLDLTCDDYPSSLCDVTCPEEPNCLSRWIRGDCDGDGFVGGSVTDGIAYTNWAFLGISTPPCLAACDVNADGFVGGSTGDVIYLFNWAFLGSPPPPAPFPDCGVGNASEVSVGCENPPAFCNN